MLTVKLIHTESKKMIGKVILVLAVISFGVVSFFAGMQWKQKNLGTLEKFKLGNSIEVQLTPNSKGSIPAGTTLYKYAILPETRTFLMFVNIKNESLLVPHDQEGKYNLVSPLDGYLKDW